jgi:5-methylcytosine-specific restriction endonuclease McrA
MKNDREDSYNSKRDYQTVSDRQSTVLKSDSGGFSSLTFSGQADRGNVDLIGFGGYIKPSNSCRITVHLEPDQSSANQSVKPLSEDWNRFGVAVEASMPCNYTAVIRFEVPQMEVRAWGIGIGALNLPEKVVQEEPDGDDLSADHLAPETFYLPTDQPPFSDLDGSFQGFKEERDHPGAALIDVKKCAYCQRYLPLTPESPGGLAFHKHSSKKTDHQNECRACKKWRINNELNELRTHDQFHESSTISRERKILLKEPEILENIKDRYGQGLKSLVWERFDKRCFNCGTTLDLGEVELDHTRPLAYLWPIDEHATCLCSQCNNHKGDRFPVDFYNDKQLEELSGIIDLPLSELKVKDINLHQLQRIKRNIEYFAREWAPVTFQAINRKVNEMRPEEDLLEHLNRKSPDLYRELHQQLSTSRSW